MGSSMMFGMGDAGTTNLITRALAAVGKRLETIPDPTQIHYHLPKSAAHPQVQLVEALRDICNTQPTPAPGAPKPSCSRRCKQAEMA